MCSDLKGERIWEEAISVLFAALMDLVRRAKRLNIFCPLYVDLGESYERLLSRGPASIQSALLRIQKNAKAKL